MTQHRGYRFRIYPTPAQESRLIQWSDALRFLWNLAHEQRLMGLRRPKKIYPSAFDQHKELTALRRDLPWLSEVPRKACENVLNELDRAWQRCFQRVARRPKWKRRGGFLAVVETDGREAVRYTRDGIRFPKLGKLLAVRHREMLGTPRSLSISRDGEQWFVSVLCELEAPDPTPRTEPVIAIDRGITHLLATSEGALHPNPKFYERSLKRLARAQRIVSRRKKGSKNRNKAKARVTRLHRKVRRQREHVLHVESSRLAKSHGVVVIEELNVAGMVRGNLSRSIADAGWARLAEMLRYKLAWSGGTLVEVPAQYSSQTCSVCGHVDAGSRNRESFCCTGCGYVDHADLNAAKVLLTRANRSGLPVEGTVLEAARRSRKAKVTLRTPRSMTEQRRNT